MKSRTTATDQIRPSRPGESDSGWGPQVVRLIRLFPWSGTANAQIKVPYAENPKLPKIPSIKPRAG